MNIQTFIILNLAIYLPFHLFEEAVGNFPKWMYEHRWLPYHMTHGALDGEQFIYLLSNHFGGSSFVSA